MTHTGTIFYSWQSELPNSTNRGFIERALKDAAKLLFEAKTVEVEPVIDRDTAGVPGSPDIASTIFEKIEGADICVCDVSVVNREAVEAKLSRPMPNPNVLLETGYALKALGRARVVLVANVIFGPPEELPFDLRYRRIIKYEAVPGNFDRATERKRLQSSLFVALQSIYENGLPTAEISEVPPPPIPIEQGLDSYVTSSALVRRYDLQLSEIYGVPVDTPYGQDFGGLKKQLTYFNITTIRQVDDLLREHGEIAFCMGYGQRPQKCIFHGTIITLLTFVLAARLGSIEAIEQYARAMTHFHSRWWQNLLQDYDIAQQYVREQQQFGSGYRLGRDEKETLVEDRNADIIRRASSYRRPRLRKQ